MLRAIDAVLQLLLYLPHELNLPLAHRIERANAYEEAQRLHSAFGTSTYTQTHVYELDHTYTQTHARAHTFKPPRDKERSREKDKE